MLCKTLAIAIFAICVLTSTAVANSTEYYPLTPGVTYEYRVQAATGAAMESDSPKQWMLAAVTHMPADMYKGKKVIPEQHLINGQPAGLSFVAFDDSGVYYYATETGKGNRRICDPPQYLIQYPAVAGKTWTQQASEFESLNNSRKLPVLLHARIESQDEVVMVPAGVFAKCLKIKMTGTAISDGADYTIVKEMWYAPGMGMIKLVQQEQKREGTKPQTSFTLSLQLQKYEADAKISLNTEP